MSGRKYDREAIAEEVFSRMADGEWLRAICRDEHMPSCGRFLSWVNEDPKLADQYTRAREILLDVTAEELKSIADTPQIGSKSVSKATGLEITEGDMIEHRRLQVDTRKWLLSKLAPKKYGERQHIEHSGGVSLSDRMKRAEEKADGKP